MVSRTRASNLRDPDMIGLRAIRKLRYARLVSAIYAQFICIDGIIALIAVETIGRMQGAHRQFPIFTGD